MTSYPRRPASHVRSAGDRRATVLSYDEVHRTGAPKRSKAPFIWAAAVKAGHSYFTTGPIVEASVDGAGLGDTVTVSYHDMGTTKHAATINVTQQMLK